jgi:hypothetical protein
MFGGFGEEAVVSQWRYEFGIAPEGLCKTTKTFSVRRTISEPRFENPIFGIPDSRFTTTPTCAVVL